MHKEKIQKNKSIRDNEDTFDLQHEMYVTISFLMMERTFNIVLSNSLDLDNILYYLTVYGHSNIRGDNKPFKVTNFIIAYQASFETSFSVNFPRVVSSFDKFFQPNACSSDEKINPRHRVFCANVTKKML